MLAPRSTFSRFWRCLFLIGHVLITGKPEIFADCPVEPAVVQQLHSFRNLASHTCLFVDKTANRSLDEVLGEWEKNNFGSFTGYRQEGRFDRGKYIYWLRFEVYNATGDTLEPALFCGQQDRLVLYELSDPARVPRFAGRFFRDPPSRSHLLFPGKHLFLLRLLPGSRTTFLVKIQGSTDFSWDVAPHLFDQAYHAKESVRALLPYYVFHGISLGFLFFVILFSLTQYAQNRDPALLYYSLYVLGIAIFLLRLLEFRDPLITIFPPGFYDASHAPLTFLINLFYLLFVAGFLNARSTSPALYRFIRLTIWTTIGFLLVERIVYTFDIWLSWQLTLIGKLLLLLTFPYLLYLVWRTSIRLHWYILTGTSLLGASILIAMWFSVNSDGLVHGWWDMTEIPVHIGFFLEILCFMLGLAYKNRMVETEKLKLETALQSEQAEALRLQEIDAVKTRLYTNITHEFRTPLTVIAGMADQVEADAERWLAEGVQIIRRNSRQLLRLVNQMLDLRKLEARKMPLHLVQTDVLLYVKYLLESFHSQAEIKNIALHFETSLPELIMDYDPDKLQQIVSNLLSNALKFTPEGGSVGLTATEGTEAGEGLGSHLLLVVKDTGAGIPADKLPFIFDRFYQVDNESTRKAEGAGIGLALTKELVLLLGGQIWVESPVPGGNAGAQFTVALPITRNATAVMAVDAFGMSDALTGPPAAQQTPDGTVAGEIDDHPLVLLIEDNRDVVRYLRACLEKQYRLAAAHNGREGIDQAFELAPDVILCDVMMPEMDGFEVTKTLKNDERTSHIPIILLTAKADVDSRIEGLERGADAYLPKPFDKKELLVRLQNLLDGRKKLQRHYLSHAGMPGSAPASSELLPGQPLENAFVQKIRSTVETYLSDEHFSVDQLCRKIGMSQSNLTRKLKALTGYPTVKFIRFIRLSHAKTRLLETGDTIATIAYDTGFSDPNYFSRIFHEEEGVSPKAFREERRKG